MKLMHVAVISQSQENADRFYEGILKLKKRKTAQLTRTLSRELFGIEIECPLIQYGNDDFSIEVFLTAEIPVKNSPVSHICLEVEDREEFLENCRSAGLPVNKIPRGDTSLCFVEDVDGNLFEIK